MEFKSPAEITQLLPGGAGIRTLFPLSPEPKILPKAENHFPCGRRFSSSLPKWGLCLTGSPEFMHAHPLVPTAKRHQMSALFLQHFSVLEEMEWGHVILPTASDPARGQPSGRKPARADSLSPGEMKPWGLSLTQSPCEGRHCARAASSRVGAMWGIQFVSVYVLWLCSKCKVLVMFWVSPHLRQSDAR